MRRYFTPVRTIALLVLLTATTGAWACPGGDKSDQRKLLESGDNAAVIINKLSKARVDLANAGLIDAPTGIAVDQQLLRVNRVARRVTHAADEFARNPANGSNEVVAALHAARSTIEEVKTSVSDGSLGVKNPDSKRSINALLDSLKALTTTIETAVTNIQRKAGK